MSQRDMFERTVASLHEAMLDDAHWPAASALIDQVCGTTGNELVVAQGSGRADARILFAGLYYRGQRHEELEREYPDIYFAQDERVPRIPRLPDSRVVHVADLYTDRELKTSTTYNEALPRAGAQNSLNVRLDGPDRTHIIWMLADPSKSSGWESGQIKVIESLLPHIRQFVRVRQALVDAEALGASSAALLENTQVGVIQLNRGGTIVAANDRAMDILSRGEGLVDRGGFLSAQTPTDNVRLKKLLALALPAGAGQAAGGSMTVGRSSHLPRLALHVNPVTVQQMDLSPQRIAALVLVVDPLSQPRIDPDLVAETLGLTLAESRVATALAEGSNVRDIAAATRRKESTVRWFVKQIYEKQGISRQADLVRLGMSLADLSGSLDSNVSASVQKK